MSCRRSRWASALGRNYGLSGCLSYVRHSYFACETGCFSDARQCGGRRDRIGHKCVSGWILAAFPRPAIPPSMCPVGRKCSISIVRVFCGRRISGAGACSGSPGSSSSCSSSPGMNVQGAPLSGWQTALLLLETLNSCAESQFIL